MAIAIVLEKKRLDLPVSKHFIEAGHNEWDIQFMIVDTVPHPRRGGDRLSIHKKCKLKWIYMLLSLKPKGLNVEFKVSQSMLS